MKSITTMLLAVTLFWGVTQVGHARTINVPDDYETIQGGIEAAEDGDEVVLADGTYRGAGNLNIGFTGKAITVRSENGPDRCIIDPERQHRAFIFNRGETSSSKLIGVTIIRGRAQNPAYGGGIYCDDQSSPEIRDCRILDCDAAGWGGGVEIETASNPTFYNTVIAGNRCDNGAGVLACTGSQPVFTNCAIVRNTGIGVYSRGAGEDGGTRVTLVNSIVFHNSASNLNAGSPIPTSFSAIQGGYEGEGNIDSDPMFLDSDNGDFRLHRNSPCVDAGDPDSDPDPDGTRADMGAYPITQPLTLHVPDDFETIQAAIDEAIDGDTVLVAPGEYAPFSFNHDTLIVISNYFITRDYNDIENTVIDGDNQNRCVYFNDSECTLVGFTIRNGMAGNGGGVYFHYSNSTISDCRILQNSSDGGSGIWLNSSVTIQRCLIADNVSSGDGGGIYCRGQLASASIVDCLIQDNEADIGGGIYCNNESRSVVNRCLIAGNLTNTPGASFAVGGHSVIEVLNSTLSNNISEGISRDREIGVFYCGNGSSISIAGSIVYGNTPPLSRCYGDGDQNRVNISFSDFEGGIESIEANDNVELNWLDGNIDSDPMFLDPDNGDFRLSNMSPCIDAGDPESDLDPDGTRADMGAFYVHQTIQNIPLRAGWSLLSSFNQPRISTMPEVWSEIIGRENLYLCKDQSGRFYRPGIFNGLPPWDVRQGYYAKLEAADTLVIVNVPVPVDTPIPLRQNWNIVAYFPEQELDVRDAFANIIDDLIMVKDTNGRFYRVQAGYSNMPPMKRGQGYQVAMSSAAELVYPVGEGMQAAGYDATTDDKPQHFQAVECTGGNMSVLLNVECRMKNAECEIGVFTEKGLCVGASVFASLTKSGEAISAGSQDKIASLRSQRRTLVGLAVWADDPTTPEIDGAVEGEALRFRLWDGKSETSGTLILRETGRMLDLRNGREETSGTLILRDGDRSGRPVLLFQTDGFAEGTLDVGAFRETPLPCEFVLYDAYPNPFNSTTVIRYDLPNTGRASVTICDLSGREVIRLADGVAQAGNYSVVWNADSAPAGVYLIKLTTPEGVFTNKVCLIK